jgi:hypothetical protein
MSFDLPDEVVEPVEPEPFTQGVEPDVAPEAPETPVEAPQEAAEPAPPAVQPEWLDREPEPPPGQYPNQYPPEPPPQLPPQPPAYPPQPPAQFQPPAQTGADAALQKFVDAPDPWARAIAQDVVNQATGQLGWNQQQLAGQINQIRETYAKAGIGQAKSAVRKAYQFLNEDPVFRTNKDVQERIGRALEGSLENAKRAAFMGDYGPISDVSQLDETSLKGMLAFVKATANVPSPGVGPLQVEGATVESSRSAVAPESVVLTPVQEAVAERMGPNYRDKMIKRQIENIAAGDVEMG